MKLFIITFTFILLSQHVCAQNDTTFTVEILKVDSSFNNNIYYLIDSNLIKETVTLNYLWIEKSSSGETLET